LGVARTVPSSGKSSPKRKPTEAEKELFFAALDRVGSVVGAARELGLNENTCAGWARKGHPGQG